MDTENRFWLITQANVIVFIVGLVIAINAWQANTDKKIIELVKAGATPAEAYCALRGSQEASCEIQRGQHGRN